MKSFFRNKKTKELIEVHRCDFCGSLMTEFRNEDYERICSLSGKMDRMCSKCGEVKMQKNT